ncbi:hypothetical protein R1flu_001283 [Riccia fluitans]|uniref:Uncharacterized protein n=1 Tax=Riccia fluitans TaxID=41844 RepID=A0ABD1Y322_9MARC
MDVLGSSQGLKPPQEMADIVEADVDVAVCMANSWAGLDALDSVPGTDLTPDWDNDLGTFVDNALLVGG